MHTSVNLVKFLATHLFAKSSELVHPKVLAKLKGRKKMKQAVRQDQTLSWHKEPFDSQTVPKNYL